VDEVNHAMIHRILDHSWGIHGRIASREQVQISLAFRSTRAGSNCSWAGGNTPSAPGANAQAPMRC
jgi:hypothetical protein